jgi:hypothetical protein
MEIKNYTYEEACTALKLDAKKELPFKGKNLTGRQKCSNAHTKLMIINEAMHIGYEGDKDYFPVFRNENHPSGFGFLGTSSDDWYTVTYVGARLQYATRAMSDAAALKHPDIYHDLLAKNI